VVAVLALFFILMFIFTKNNLTKILCVQIIISIFLDVKNDQLIKDFLSFVVPINLFFLLKVVNEKRRVN